MGRPRKSKQPGQEPNLDYDRGPSPEELRSIEAEFNGEEETDLTSLIEDERTSKRHPIQSFLRNYGTRKPFRGTDEIGRLVERYHGGNTTERQAALREIIAGTALLVVSVQRRHYSRHDVPLDDLLQEGVLGITEAVDRYRFEWGAWSTYVTWWIRSRMQRLVLDTNTRDVCRVPVHVQDLISKLDKAHRKYEAKHGSHPTAEELQRFIAKEAEADGKKPLDLAKVQASLEVTRRRATTVRVDAPLLGDDGETDANRGRKEMSSLPGQEIGLDARREYEFQRDRYLEALQRLSEVEKAVLFLRCGIGKKVTRELTLKEVGDLVEKSRERVRQIEAKALHKLRNALEADSMKIVALLCLIDDAGDISSGYDAMVVLRRAWRLSPVTTEEAIALLDAKRRQDKAKAEKRELSSGNEGVAALVNTGHQVAASESVTAAVPPPSPDASASLRASTKKGTAPPARVPPGFRSFVRLLLLAPNQRARTQLFRDLLLAYPPLAQAVIDASPKSWGRLQRMILEVAEKISRTSPR